MEGHILGYIDMINILDRSIITFFYLFVSFYLISYLYLIRSPFNVTFIV